jgi:hypothetical protein
LGVEKKQSSRQIACILPVTILAGDLFEILPDKSG